jgi:hypothetical protein
LLQKADEEDFLEEKERDEKFALRISHLFLSLPKNLLRLPSEAAAISTLAR